jgi:hypothetical protein
LRNIDVVQAKCLHVDGIHITDLIAFLKANNHDMYLPGPTKGGKPAKFDLD